MSGDRKTADALLHRLRERFGCYVDPTAIAFQIEREIEEKIAKEVAAITSGMSVDQLLGFLEDWHSAVRDDAEAQKG